jgi:hypothetical protein
MADDLGFGSGYDPGNVNVGGAYDANVGSGLGGGLGLTNAVNPRDVWGGGGGFSGWGAVRGGLMGLLSGNPVGVAMGALAGGYAPAAYSAVHEAFLPGYGVGPAYGGNAAIWGGGAPAAGGPGVMPGGAAMMPAASPAPGFNPGVGQMFGAGFGPASPAMGGAFGNIDPRSQMYAQALMQQNILPGAAQIGRQ